MRVLRGRIERVILSRGIVLAQHTARFHRVRDKAVVFELQRRDMGRASKRRIRRSGIAQLPVVTQVFRRFVVYHGRLSGHGLRHIDDGGENAVIDLDQFSRIARFLQAFCDNRRNRIADVADFAVCEDRVWRFLLRLAVFVGHAPAARNAAQSGIDNILSSKDTNNTRCVRGRICVDAVQRRMGGGRA